MRVLITSGIFPPDIGGPATYVPHMAKALTAAGHSVTVVSAADEPELTKHQTYPFNVVRYSRKAPLPLKLFRSLSLVLREMRSSDVVLANGLYGLVAIAKSLIARPVLMKIVGDPAWERAIGRGYTTNTIDEFQTGELTWKAKILAVLRNLAVRRADLVVTPSEYLKRIVLHWAIPAEKIKVIRNAVEVPETAPTRRVDKRLVTVCRLVSWKGVDVIIDAVALLPDVSLDIIGEGPLEEALKRQIDAGSLNSRIRLLGALPRSEVLKALSEASVCILNSAYEGLPHVLLEAILLGTPVIARDAGGCREVVSDGKCGLLLSTTTPAGLAEAVSSLLTPGALPDFAQGQALLRDRFSLAQMEEQTLSTLIVLQQNHSKGF